MIATARALNAALGLVPSWVYAAAVAALVATNCTTTLRLEQTRAVAAQAKADQARAEQQRAETARQAEADARERERSHAQALQTITQKAAHEKATLDRRAAALADSLRNRPERATGAAGGAVPEGGTDAVGCTGAGLARPDGEFLVRYAADAARLQSDFQTCQAALDAAVKLTNPD